MELWETEHRRSPVHLNAEQKHGVRCKNKAQQTSQALLKDCCKQREHAPEEKSNKPQCSLDSQQTSTGTYQRGQSRQWSQ